MKQAPNGQHKRVADRGYRLRLLPHLPATIFNSSLLFGNTHEH
jgi:hypothetical protein